MNIAVDRPFKLIAFDWDGTAVMSRSEDATAVRERLQRLLELGLIVVIITGTNFQNVNRQVSEAMFGPYKRRLFVCTNRGSEVYGFDAESRPVLIWKRVATPEEEVKLTEIAERVERWVEERTGREVEVIYDRLNRRKIDLIPLAEWREPPKSAIGDLLKAVDRRLHERGMAGGLREVLDYTKEVAREVGLPEAHVTTDVKHVEVGLTDKGDSVDWMMRELVEKNGLTAQDVLIAGDEFGPIDGFDGSDYKMVRPSTMGAVFVSVGKEPNGVPPEVIHLGGGPPRFVELLDRQIALHERRRPEGRVAPPAPAAPGPTPSIAVPVVASHGEERAAELAEDRGWRLVETGFNPSREHEIESIFCVGNGYLGTRGALSEGTTISRPSTFVAGCYNNVPSSTAVPELVKAPDWARIRVFVDGEEIRLESGEMLEQHRILDLKRGILFREWRQKDPAGRVTRLRYMRFASLADCHAVVESVTITPENYGATIAVESSVEASAAAEPAVAYRTPPTETQPVLSMLALGSEVEIALAMSTTLRPDMALGARYSATRTESSLTQRWEWSADLDRDYRVDKLVSVYTSRDVPDPARAAVDHLALLREQGLDQLRDAHERAWAERWRIADVEIEGDLDDQRAIRFAIYHLISAANVFDYGVSIGARGLTGEAYKGHVFWDTDVFMLPFFTFTEPNVARILLMYRYHTLPAARDRAERLGYHGALYAWESTDTGEDVTPSVVFTPDGEMIEILSGEMEHHISADVAYAVWRYWEATHDERFLLEAGAEIILETARFWASRVELGSDGCYHILRVIGPDEYHEGVDDNAYTNVMAQWNLERGLEVADMLRRRWPERWKELSAKLGLDDAELDRWRAMARDMYTGFNPETGLFEQFKGFFGLDYVDLKAFGPRTAPMDIVLGRKRTQQSQVIKQADVVMLLALLWDRFSPEVREANYRYYEPRTDHGSSLSPAIHALVAARLGDLARAHRYFKQSAAIDLANNMGNAAFGVHMAAQGALWQAVVFGFGGLTQHEDALSFQVRLAPSWQMLRFPIAWRSRRLCVVGQRKPMRAEVKLETGKPVSVSLGDAPPKVLESGKQGLVRRWKEPRRGKQPKRNKEVA